MKIDWKDQNSVIINDLLVVEETSDGLRTTQVPFPSLAKIGEPKKDRHYYRNGNNGLSMEESVERAVSGVEDTLDKVPSTNYSVVTPMPNQVRNGVRHMLESGSGRNDCYVLAGQVLKAYREGRIWGISIDAAFEIAALYGRAHLNLYEEE